MIHLAKLTMTLVALFAMTTGAWADEPKVHTQAVAITDLHEGDILAEGFSLTGNDDDRIWFNAGRYKKNGALQTMNDSRQLKHISSFEENGVITAKDGVTFAPVDEDGLDGNAWVVTQVYIGSTFTTIWLSGIYYVPNAVSLSRNGNEWTLTMPAADVELTVDYYDDATVTGTATAATGIRAGDDKALVTGLTANGGTLVWAVTANNVTTAPADGDFAEGNNTAKGLTAAGTYRVWYFAAGDDTHSSSEVAYIDVTVLTNKFDLTLTAANALTIEDGKVSVTVGGTPASPDDEGKITGVTMGETVTMTAAEGYKIVSANASDGSTDTPVVTLNDAKTEATLTMPASDVTLSYRLRRDLAVGTAVTVADAQQNSRFRVQKQNDDTYQPVGMTTEDVLALITVSDQIEQTSLTVGDDCNPLFFPVDDQGEPQGDGVALANFGYAPGNYIVKAVAISGTTYVGQTDQSNIFQLYDTNGITVKTSEHGKLTFTVDDQEVTTAEPGKTVTVTVAPVEGWITNAVTAAQTGQTAVDVSGSGNEWTFTMPDADVQVSATYKKLLTNADITIDDIAAVTYSGSAQTPTVTVKDGSAVLKKDVDYTLTYKNNVNAALATAATAPTVTITTVATSNYSGSASKTFTINPKAVTITAGSQQFTYNGTAQSSAGYQVEGLVGNDNIEAVVEGSITFPSQSPVTNKLKSYSFTAGTAGNYDVTTKDGELTMTNASVAITITAASGEWTYDGSAHTAPAVTLTSGSLFTGDNLVATATGSVTNVADTKADNNPVATDYKVVHGDEDVTDNYVITAVAGTLTIVRDMTGLFSESYEWATYVANEDLTLPEGIEAYAVTDVTTTAVEVEAIGYIPAGVGILLKRSNTTKNSYVGTVYEGTATTVESKLTGSATAATALTAYYDFVLYRDEFVLSSISSVGAGKAYLPAATAPANAARALTIGIGEGTGLTPPLTPPLTGAGDVYDIQGRKVNAMPTRKGLYIMNGRKVVIK